MTSNVRKTLLEQVKQKANYKAKQNLFSVRRISRHLKGICSSDVIFSLRLESLTLLNNSRLNSKTETVYEKRVLICQKFWILTLFLTLYALKIPSKQGQFCLIIHNFRFVSHCVLCKEWQKEAVSIV